MVIVGVVQDDRHAIEGVVLVRQRLCSGDLSSSRLRRLVRPKSRIDIQPDGHNTQLVCFLVNRHVSGVLGILQIRGTRRAGQHWGRRSESFGPPE